MNVPDNRNPIVAEQFKAGNFTVRKSFRKNCAIAIAHAHEKNNKHGKGGGVIGITESSSQLDGIWSVTGSANKSISIC